jgi:outer membrane protein OmpA-like peptidoglycan-associated protein
MKKNFPRAIAWLCFVPGAALAQSADISAEFFQPNAGNSYFSVRAAKLLRDGQLQVFTFLNYADDPVVTVQRQDEREIVSRLVDNQSALDIGLAYGLKDRVELSAALPLALFQNGDAPPGKLNDGAAVQGAALGDLRLGAKVRLLGDPKEREGFFLSFIPELSLPTGRGEVFFGDASAVFRAPLAAQVKRGALDFGATAGVRIQKNVSIGNVDAGDSVDLGLGLSYEISPKLIGTAEANGSFSFSALRALSQEAAGATGDIPAEARAGARVKLAPGFWLPVGAGAGLSNGLGAPDFRLFAGVLFSPEQAELPVDADQDGIVDSRDACPNLPEDQNGLEDGDGCPDDPDQDGLASAQDQCPNVAGLASLAGCPDEDEDGFADAKDQCPREAEDKNGLEDSDGCPDDPDQDGIVSASDQCPTVAGLGSFAGCPDSDGDGLADASDKCPASAEDFDKIKDEDGCPETDADADAFSDEKDLCALEAEDNKGALEGCPESVKVSIKDGSILILEKVYFDTSRASLQKRSFEILNSVAQVIKEHPELGLVEVGGHTDDADSNPRNLTLSTSRAKTVREYLISKGVDAARLTAKGYGEESPLVPVEGLKGKDLKAAREQNRRVEFTLQK